MGLTLTFAPLTDVGRDRSENQDFFGSREVGDVACFIVCDGMGGHRGGSTASRVGVEVIAEVLGDASQPVPERLRASFLRANAAIYQQSQASAELRGMGTTAVVLAIDARRGVAWTAHVGDSRLYRVRGDEIRQLTRDHTFVQRLVDDGILTWEAAEAHPQSNVILRSLGGQAEVEPEVTAEPFEVREGDVFLLCSDGLHGLVGEQEMAVTVTTMPAADAARVLVDRANEEGGHDNVTVEIIAVGAPAPHEGTYRVERPGPAPGTRLAKQQAAALTERDAAPEPRPSQPAPDNDPSITAARPIIDEADERPRWVGPFMLVALVSAILIVAITLYLGAFQGSSAASQSRGAGGPEPAAADQAARRFGEVPVDENDDDAPERAPEFMPGEAAADDEQAGEGSAPRHGSEPAEPGDEASGDGSGNAAPTDGSAAPHEAAQGSGHEGSAAL